jgi:short-subunit dehydrogenase
VHVAVTGASTGIGRAIAREFAAAGAKLTLVARREDLLKALAAELGAGHVAAVDLADPSRATGWIEASVAAQGPIDVLVNNAGVELVACLAETDIDAAERLLRLNLHTPLRITLALLPGMIERRSGTIVDVASVAGLVGTRGYTYYAASKAGLAAASELLRGELRGTGVHVVTVYPGPIHSEMAERGIAALESSPWLDRAPWGTAEVLATRVRRAVEAKRPRVIYPSFYMLSRWFPWLGRWIADATAPGPRSLAPGQPPA